MSSSPKIHEIQGFIQVMYLVESPSGLLLLDGGCRCDVEVVCEFIEKTLQRPIEDLKLVVITHAHPDHSGGATGFQDLGIPVAGSAKSNQWYAGLSGFFTYLVDIFLTYIVAFRVRQEGKLKNVFFSRMIVFDHILRHGDVLPGFSEWTVIESPGHTASDISLFHEESLIAYVADNLISSKTGFFRPYPLVYPQKYKQSLERYLKLGIQTFLLAHYGRYHISSGEILRILQSTPEKPRRHKTTLPSILIGLVSKRKRV